MPVVINVKRFNPQAADEASRSYWQDYQVEVDRFSTVLDTLMQIREQQDGTLGLRCSCRSAICGSCAMRVNGRSVLACKTKVSDSVGSNNTITVEPMGNMPVVKDLVADLTPFWDKVMAVEPWMQPSGPEPENEYLAPNEAMLHLAGVMDCILCGACVSSCTVMEVDPNFLGPAALAKAYRFVADPRDDADNHRLEELSKSTGIWDCTRCFECVEACPKGVAPMDRIMALRDKAMEAGYDKTIGARHTDAFVELVGHSGRLDELKLPIKTVGIMNLPALINFAPVGLRAALKRKMPPLIHKGLPGDNARNVRRLFKRAENEKKSQQS